MAALGAPPPHAFALTPAAANPGIIDYGTHDGQKFFKNATQRLNEELYDCVPEGMFTFLKSLKLRANLYGWNNNTFGILMIPRNVADPNTEYDNLLELYGQVDIETILNYERTYIALPCRAAQDALLMFVCLMNSISNEGKAKIHIWEKQYTIVAADGEEYSSGNLLLKIIIRESHLDTNATTTTIRTNLSSLDLYLPRIGHDITKFNQYVQLMVQALKSRGETTQDLLTNLFKGYVAASDKTFVTYIERKQEEFDDGQELTPESLMTLADNKFKNLKQKEIWNAPSPEEEKLLALEAEMKTLKAAAKKQKKQKSSSDTKGNETTQEDKGKKKKPKPQWMVNNERPKDAELNLPRSWNGRKWYFCCPETRGKCDGQWRAHLPSACKGLARAKGDPKRKQRPEQEEPQRKLKLAKAYEGVASREKDSDSDNH